MPSQGIVLGSNPNGSIMINKGDIIEVYDTDHLTVCRHCIGIVDCVIGPFVMFKVAKVLTEPYDPETKRSIARFDTLSKEARGEYRSTLIDNIIRHKESQDEPRITDRRHRSRQFKANTGKATCPS